jgi:hypothetical protein
VGLDLVNFTVLILLFTDKVCDTLQVNWSTFHEMRSVVQLVLVA